MSRALRRISVEDGTLVAGGALPCAGRRRLTRENKRRPLLCVTSVTPPVPGTEVARRLSRVVDYNAKLLVFLWFFFSFILLVAREPPPPPVKEFGSRTVPAFFPLYTRPSVNDESNESRTKTATSRRFRTVHLKQKNKKKGLLQPGEREFSLLRLTSCSLWPSLIHSSVMISRCVKARGARERSVNHLENRKFDRAT